MASFQNRIIKNFVRSAKAMYFKRGRPMPEYRQLMLKVTSMAKVPEGVQSEKTDCNGVPGEWFYKEGTSPETVVLYFHGGAYTMGSIDTHRGLIAHLVLASGARFLAIEYRLAPEHPFPAGLQDAITAYEWLQGQGYNPEQIIFAGDSAGGGMTIASMLRLRQDQKPMPRAGICLSPWLDLEGTGKSAERNAKTDPMVDLESVKEFALLYAPEEELRNPLVSPIHADPSGLPPLFIQVSDAELLLDDTRRFVKKAKKSGVKVELEIWDNMVHVWQAFGVYLPEAMQAIQKIGDHIKEITKETASKRA